MNVHAVRVEPGLIYPSLSAIQKGIYLYIFSPEILISETPTNLIPEAVHCEPFQEFISNFQGTC